MLADTPPPPYVAVIFTAVLRSDVAGYEPTSMSLRDLASRQAGFLGMESAGGGPGGLEVTVSYWHSEADAHAWKTVTAHEAAQRKGRDRWYQSYRVRVTAVTREYGV